MLTCSKFPLVIFKSSWIIWQRSCSWYVEARNLHNSKRQSSSDAAVASSCVGQSPIPPCLPLHSLTIPSPRKFNLSKMFHVGPKWCEIMKWSDRVLDIASKGSLESDIETGIESRIMICLRLLDKQASTSTITSRQAEDKHRHIMHKQAQC